MTWIHHLSLLLTAIIWGSTYVNIKIVLEEVPPNTLAFLRFLIASIVLGGYFFIFQKPHIKKSHWPRAALGGLVGIALYNFLQNQGLKYAGATEGAILGSTAPVFMVLLAWPYLHEKITWRQAGGIVAAFLGAAIVSTGGTLESISLNPLRLYGDFLVLLTGLAWAVYNITIKVLLERYPAVSVLTYCTWAGTIFLLPFAFFDFPVDLFQVSPWVWANIIYLGLFGSAAAYLLWNAALTRVAMATAGAYLYLLPVASAAIAAVFLHEAVTIFTLVGGGLALIGTYWASDKR